MAPTHYSNFDIRIYSCESNRLYVVTGETDYRETEGVTGNLETSGASLVKFPENISEISKFLRGLVGEPEEINVLADSVREFLFPPEVWNLFSEVRRAVEGKGKGLRIRLRLGDDTPELNRIPWEYCADSKLSFLSLDTLTPIVRYLPLERAAYLPISVPDTTKILVVMASDEEQPINTEAEEGWLRQALAPLAERIELHVLPRAREKELRDCLQGFDPHILYFLCHGGFKGKDGVLRLEDGELSAHDLYLLLRKGKNIKLVFLNACESAVPGIGADNSLMGIGPRLVLRGIPAVIAMQFPIPYETATAFAHEFFRLFLVEAQPIDVAIAEARVEAYFTDKTRAHWAIPVLFMRTPTGIIWQPAAPVG